MKKLLFLVILLFFFCQMLISTDKYSWEVWESHSIELGEKEWSFVGGNTFQFSVVNNKISSSEINIVLKKIKQISVSSDSEISNNNIMFVWRNYIANATLTVYVKKCSNGHRKCLGTLIIKRKCKNG